MSDPHDDRMGRPDGHHYDAPESDEERAGKSWLHLDGYAVDWLQRGDQVATALTTHTYQCILLDRGLPGLDGDAVLRTLRGAGGSHAQVPVIVITARDTLADRVQGLDLGADDYLVKPFAVPELVARVRSLCRRAAVVRPPVHRVGDVEIDTARRQVRRGGVLLTLTSREFAVLEVLAARGDQAVSRAELIESCWDEMAEPQSNVLDVLVSQLRRKLGDPPLIHTVRGVGYRLAADGGSR